jgi:[ribosomal protein S18]-alanine N-acetyltransferase
MSRIAGVSVKGTWPGALVLRSGWSKAIARPWNDLESAAGLRFERGSAEFVRACTETLFSLGAPRVYSAPVHRSGMTVWERAGFVPDRQLVLMERSLARPPSESDPPLPTETGVVESVVAIDRAAFDPDWQIGRLGLEDALSATVHSRLIVPRDDAGCFAIVGVTGSTSYLQRLAVDPAEQGRGLGRRLLRESMRWARGAGARSMLLNTQPENDRATALYRTEGFEMLAERLTVLRAEPGTTDEAP